ncbi:PLASMODESMATA CALLOSE-BINDING PROTEIN 5 [Forsythia ovata]|uniref:PLASMODESMATA CALLOSE-BINDING PROTEIN 5 n=1 Tax=Forsythia ovata TaxID=205694 RepID=A0ABD1SBF6_9LAMI
MASGILTWVLSFFFFALAVVQGGGGGRGGGAAEELWCVAKNNAADDALQSSLDWACGPGGANCGPIQKGGPCYDPSDLQRTASFAFNDYFVKHGLTEDSCSFSNSAALTSLNPSHNNCKFPSSSLSRSNGKLYWISDSRVS